MHPWIVNRWIVYRELAQPLMQGSSAGATKFIQNDSSAKGLYLIRLSIIVIFQ